MKSKYKRTKFKFTKNVHSLLFLLVISLLAPSVFLFTAGDEKGKELSVFSTNVIDSIDYPEHSLAAINESEYSQLASVGNVIDYPVSNSVATAVLIEQTHKYPNSNSSDKINDDAEATQGQILGILDKLHNEDDIDILLNEGIVYNEEEEKKIEEVSAKIELRDDFSSTLDDLKDETSKENNNFAVEKLITDSDQFVDSMDREIILEGAPYVLKSKDEDDDLKIYGAEKQETRDEAAGIVRKYMYLQDAQSKSNSLFRNSLSRNNESVNIGTAASLSSMLGQNSGDSNANLKSEFELVEKLSQYLGGDDLRFLVSKLGGIYEQISNLDEVRQSGDAKYLPSRDDNPYLSVSAKEKAKMMEETKQEINDCVIDQRNIDVADIFTDIIKDSDEKIGIIQFGRGHTEGLVEELNKQGISVTVITPAKIM